MKIGRCPPKIRKCCARCAPMRGWRFILNAAITPTWRRQNALTRWFRRFCKKHEAARGGAATRAEGATGCRASLGLSQPDRVVARVARWLLGARARREFYFL